MIEEEVERQRGGRVRSKEVVEVVEDISSRE